MYNLIEELNINRYEPNWRDPRVLKAAKSALGVTLGFFKTPDTIRELSSLLIRDLWGKHNLGEYLQTKLLICVCHQYDVERHISKKYKRNNLGIQYILDKLADTKRSKKKMITECVADALNNFRIFYKEDLSTILDGTIIYSEKKDRLHTRLQNLTKHFKRTLLSEIGLIHEYDINCCSVTLLYQLAEHCGMTEKLETIDYYIADRTKYRLALATELDIPVDDAKRIVNAMFNGARLDYGIANILKSFDKVELLRKNEFYKNIKADLSIMWSFISPTIKNRRKNINGHLIPLNGKDKSAIYRSLEFKVLKSVMKYLDKTNNKYMPEHDGWTTSNKIKLVEFYKFIKLETGFNIKLDYEKNNKVIDVCEQFNISI